MKFLLNFVLLNVYDMNERKRILVLGATSGLGRGLAERYISEGHIVGIAGRRENELINIAANHKNVHYSVLDVMNIDEVIIKLAKLVDDMGGVDLFIHSSGVGKMNPSLDSQIELLTVDTNVRGWTVIMDWIFNYFKQNGGGQIAAITSIAGLRGLSPAPSYAASKAYQIHYLDSLRQRAIALKLPIIITDIRPGFVNTPLLAHPEKLFWVLNKNQAINAIYHVIEKKKRHQVVTKRWALLAPILKYAPEWIVAKILKRAL